MKRTFTFFLLFIVTFTVKSQIITEVPKLPGYIPNSNFGTEFYLTAMPYQYDGWGIPYWYVFLSSEFETDVQITHAYGNKNYIIKLLPNKITKLILYSWEISPYYPFNNKESEEKVYINAAMHFVSKEPISVFFDTDIAYTSDMYSVIPTCNWGKEYVLNTYYSHNWSMTFNPSNNLASSAVVLSGFDSTEVVFTLNGHDSTETLSGIKHGRSKKFFMNKGDVLPIATSLKQNSTLAGSRIYANKPIGVLSGVQCADVPKDISSCDNLIEMELPNNTWGKTFHISKNKNRKIVYLFQVVAKEPNTTLYVNDQKLKVLEKIDETQLVEWAEFNQQGNKFSHNFVLTADKPISVSVFNQSGLLDSSNINPYQMVLTPVEQYRKNIRSLKIDVGDGGGYSNYFLNIVFPLDSNLKTPQDLQWGDSKGDSIIWIPFIDKWGDSVDYIYEGFQYGKKYAVKYLTLKKEECFQIQSNENIAIYTYGNTPYKAFGVPAFLGLRDVTVQDSLPPLFQFIQTADGTLVGINGNQKALINDLYKPEDSSSKLSLVYCQFSQSVNYDVQIERFIPGDDASTSFTASVIDKSKDAQLVLTAIDRAGNDTTILITQKATISSVNEEESEVELRVIPSTTEKSPVMIEFHNKNTQSVTLSIVSIHGKTMHIFENLPNKIGTHSLQLDTKDFPIGMYYVIASVNGKQYQQSFVKMK